MTNGSDKAAASVARIALADAKAIGVRLDIDHDGGTIRFAITRGDAPAGSGVKAIKQLLDLADTANVPVSLDVMAADVALIAYYWRLGFRIHDGTPVGERGDLVKLKAEIAAFIMQGRIEDFGVTSMWRDRHAGALEEIASIPMAAMV